MNARDAGLPADFVDRLTGAADAADGEVCHDSDQRFPAPTADGGEVERPDNVRAARFDVRGPPYHMKAMVEIPEPPNSATTQVSIAVEPW